MVCKGAVTLTASPTRETDQAKPAVNLRGYGCGGTFDWSQALGLRPLTSIVTASKGQPEYQKYRNRRSKNVYFDQQCTRCHRTQCELLYLCMNCDGVFLCHDCVFKNDHHDLRHIFKPLYRPEDKEQLAHYLKIASGRSE